MFLLHKLKHFHVNLALDAVIAPDRFDGDVVVRRPDSAAGDYIVYLFGGLTDGGDYFCEPRMKSEERSVELV